MRLINDHRPVLEEGEIFLADGGTHGRAGHQIWIDTEGSAYWRRATDSLMPHGRVGRAPFEMSEQELADFRACADTAWAIAERQRQERIAHSEKMRAFLDSPEVQNRAPGLPPPVFPDIRPPQIPRWIWCFAQKRNGKLRVAKGSDVAPEEPKLQPALSWLAQTVDRLAAAAPIEQVMLYADAPPLGRPGLYDGCVTLLETEFEGFTSTKLELFEPEGPLLFQCTAMEEMWNTGMAPATSEDLEALRQAAGAAWDGGQSLPTVEQLPLATPGDAPLPERAWGVFVRRGQEIRAAHGEGDVADAMRPHFDWMKERVPALVAANEHVWNASTADDE